MSKTKFVREWIGFNLAGWIIGNIIYTINYQPYLLFSSAKNPESKIVLCLLICVGLASIQWFRLKLKDWNVQLVPWILVTSIGWGTSASICWGTSVPILGWFLDYLHQVHASVWLSIGLYAVGIFMIGAIIGIIQAITMRKSLTKPNLWVLANGFGLLISGIYVIGINIVAVTFKSPIANFLNSIGFYTYLHGGRTMLLLFIWMSLPLIGTLTTAIPTGIILSKYGIRHSSSANGFAKNPVN